MSESILRQLMFPDTPPPEKPPIKFRRARAPKSEGAFLTIGELAEQLKVEQHVLRYWESKFPEIQPLKRAGGRRYYRPEDVETIRRIQAMLYRDGYTIRGAQKALQETEPTAVTTNKFSSTVANLQPEAPQEVRISKASLNALIEELRRVREMLKNPA